MSTGDYKLIDEQVGLLGGIALLIGTALGMAVFIVPTQMAALAGPSITLALLIAIVPAILAILVLLQLGGAIPVAGGIYVYGSRLVGPYWGFIVVLIPVMAIWSYLLFAALGIAEYATFFVDLPTLAIVWAVLVAFLGLNYVGLRIVTKVQLALVAVLLGGIAAFVGFGAFSIEPTNYDPMFPDELYDSGLGPFLIAVVTLYTPLQGFNMIVELGEELDSPAKNIPRVLGIGMGIVALLTFALVLVLAGAVPWQESVAIVDDGGGLAAAADGFAPWWATSLVGVAALVAGMTTINAYFTSYSRTVMRAGRDGIVPGYFAAIHDDYETPYRSIVLLGLPPILFAPVVVYLDGLLAVEVLDWLIVFITTGVFLAFTIAGVALWNLPDTFPQRYEYSIYKLPLPVLRVVAVGNVVASLVLMLFVAAGMPSAFGLVIFVMAAGYVAYRYRLRRSERRGVDLEEQMALLDKHERIDADDDAE